MAISQAPVPAIVTTSFDEPMGLIQGQMPMSINEWYVSVALDRLQIEYTYQYPIGTFGVRGSQKIDFVCWTGLGGIPVYVQGAYWHDIRHDPDAVINQAEAQRYFGNAPVLLMEEETGTKEKAFMAVRDKVGVL